MVIFNFSAKLRTISEMTKFLANYLSINDLDYGSTTRGKESVLWVAAERMSRKKNP